MDLFLDAHVKAPGQITLDLDATDDPLHGHQEGRFFHGYYDHYCYLPLYFFCGDRLLCARLREADEEPATGCVEELSRIVAQVRAAWLEDGHDAGATAAALAAELRRAADWQGLGEVVATSTTETSSSSTGRPATNGVWRRISIMSATLIPTSSAVT
mgnify:CR=1 FL=1